MHVPNPFSIFFFKHLSLPRRWNRKLPSSPRRRSLDGPRTPARASGRSRSDASRSWLRSPWRSEAKRWAGGGWRLFFGEGGGRQLYVYISWILCKFCYSQYCVFFKETHEAAEFLEDFEIFWRVDVSSPFLRVIFVCQNRLRWVCLQN